MLCAMYAIMPARKLMSSVVAIVFLLAATSAWAWSQSAPHVPHCEVGKGEGKSQRVRKCVKERIKRGSLQECKGVLSWEMVCF